VVRADAAVGDESVLAYASILSDGTVQGMVDPGARRRGIGSALVRAVLDARPDAGVWVHGADAGTLDFLTRRGLTVSRTLLQMSWDPATAPDPGTAAPDATSQVDTFDPARDREEIVRVNGAAFVDHPEQGAMTLADLDERLAEDWFDPTDLHVARVDGGLAAFVWVKREGPADVVGATPAAEIYVVATDPAHTGRGLARALLARALTDLRASPEVEEVELYVEGDNHRARRLYDSFGFRESGRDVQLRIRTKREG
jgi:mycothiol synthase